MTDGIWVVDSNLFQPGYSRRFLFGLAAYLDEPLVLVPALFSRREVPNAIAMGLALPERFEESEWLRGRLRDDVLEWLDNEVARDDGLFALRELPDTYDAEKRFDALEGMFRRDPQGRYPQDIDIVMEALAVGCDFIATNNLRTIRHNKINQWGRTELGRNRDVIGTADDLVERLFDNKRTVALVMAGMAVATSGRADAEEVGSVLTFAEKLQTNGWDQTGLEIGERIRLHEAYAPFIAEARDLSRTPQFQRARQAEDTLQWIYAEVLATARQRAFVADLTDGEVRLLDKYLNPPTRDGLGH